MKPEEKAIMNAVIRKDLHSKTLINDEKVTILYTVRNYYEMFRMSIESVFKYIPDNHYKEIIIVDDCSDRKEMIDFLRSLEEQYEKVKIVRPEVWSEDGKTKIKGGPLKWGYYNKHGRSYEKIRVVVNDPKLETSFGHGGSLNYGITEVDTEYVLILDSDTIMLPKAKSLIPKLLECFALDEKILSVGQVAGKVDGIKVFDKIFYYHRTVGDEPVKIGKLGDENIRGHGGATNACLMMCKMSSWIEHKLNTFSNSGWAHGSYVFQGPYSILMSGFKTCNFNTFKDGYAIHIGYSTVRQTREANSKTLGFVQGCGGYGSLGNTADHSDWYGGYYAVNVDTTTLEKILVKEYNYDYKLRKSIIHMIMDSELLKEE